MKSGVPQAKTSLEAIRALRKFRVSSAARDEKDSSLVPGSAAAGAMASLQKGIDGESLPAVLDQLANAFIDTDLLNSFELSVGQVDTFVYALAGMTGDTSRYSSDQIYQSIVDADWGDLYGRISPLILQKKSLAIHLDAKHHDKTTNKNIAIGSLINVILVSIQYAKIIIDEKQKGIPLTSFQEFRLLNRLRQEAALRQLNKSYIDSILNAIKKEKAEEQKSSSQQALTDQYFLLKKFDLERALKPFYDEQSDVEDRIKAAQKTKDESHLEYLETKRDIYRGIVFHIERNPAYFLRQTFSKTRVFHKYDPEEIRGILFPDNLSGVRRVLAKDFDLLIHHRKNRIQRLVRCLNARLIFLTKAAQHLLGDESKGKPTESLERMKCLQVYLNEAAKNHSLTDNQKDVLIQACDEAYDLMQQVFHLIPLKFHEPLLEKMSQPSKMATATIEEQERYTHELEEMARQSADSLKTELDRALAAPPRKFGYILLDRIMKRESAVDEKKGAAPPAPEPNHAYETLIKLIKKLDRIERGEFFLLIEKEFGLDLFKNEMARGNFRRVIDHLRTDLIKKNQDEHWKDKFDELIPKNIFDEVAQQLIGKNAYALTISNREKWERIIRQACKVPQHAVKREGHITGDLFDAEYINIPGQKIPENATTLQLRDVISDDMSRYRWKAFKTSGAQGGSHPYTSFYFGVGLDEKGEIFFVDTLFKKDKVPAKDMIEFLVAGLQNDEVEDRTASVILALRPGANPKDFKTEDVYLGSILFNGFDEIYKKAYELGDWDPKQGEKPTYRPGGMGPGITAKINAMRFRAGVTDLPEVKLFRSGILKYLRDEEKGGLNKAKVIQLADGLWTSLKYKNFDMHPENIGLTRNGDINAIDFGASLEDLNDEIDIHSTWAHKSPTDPANNFLLYPPTLKLSEFFTRRVYEKHGDISYSATKRLEGGLKEYFNRLKGFYKLEDFRALAKRVGVEVNEDDNLDNIIEKTKTFLQRKLFARTIDTRKEAIQLMLGSCLTREGEVVSIKPGAYCTPESLARDNPLYFLSGNFHVRGDWASTEDDDASKRIYNRYLTNIAPQMVLNEPEMKQGIRGILHKDFSFRTDGEQKDVSAINVDRAARLFSLRLNILLQHFNNLQRDQKLEFHHQAIQLENWIKKPDRSAVHYSHLAILCDHTYQSLVKLYKNSPALDKVFIESLMRVDVDPKNEEAYEQALQMRVRASKMVSPLEQVITSLGRMVDAADSLDALEKLDKQAKTLAERVKKLTSSAGTDAELNPPASSQQNKKDELAEALAAIESSITYKRTELGTLRELKQAAVFKTEPEKFSKKLKRTELKPIEIKSEFCEGRTPMQAVYAQFNSLAHSGPRSRRAAQTTKSITVDVGKEVREKTKLITVGKLEFCPYPTDDRNYEDSEQPKSGFLVDRDISQDQKITRVRVQDVVAPPKYSVSKHIAEILLEHKYFKVKSKDQPTLSMIEALVKKYLACDQIMTPRALERFFGILERKKLAHVIINNRVLNLFGVSKEVPKSTEHFARDVLQQLTDRTTSKKFGKPNLPDPETLANARAWVHQIPEGMNSETIKLSGNVGDPNFVKALLLQLAVKFNLEPIALMPQKVILDNYPEYPGPRINKTGLNFNITEDDINDMRRVLTYAQDPILMEMDQYVHTISDYSALQKTLVEVVPEPKAPGMSASGGDK